MNSRGLIYFYKFKLYVDNGMSRYNTYKYVLAKNQKKAEEEILRHYTSQYDTYVKILEVQKYETQDAVMFDKLIITEQE